MKEIILRINKILILIKSHNLNIFSTLLRFEKIMITYKVQSVSQQSS